MAAIFGSLQNICLGLLKVQKGDQPKNDDSSEEELTLDRPSQPPPPPPIPYPLPPPPPGLFRDTPNTGIQYQNVVGPNADEETNDYWKNRNFKPTENNPSIPLLKVIFLQCIF